MFFAGLIMIGLMFAALFLTGLIYDAGNRQSVRAYFFRPDNLSHMRPDYPVTTAQIGDNGMVEMLLEKFVSQYFYVIPDNQDIENRIAAGPRRMLASAAVFNQWRDTQVPIIKEIAQDGGMRIASVINEIVYPTNDNQYYIVEYELATWYSPNDMDQLPTITRGRMFIDAANGGFDEYSDLIPDITKYLEAGNDAAPLFKFVVRQVVLETE